MKRKRKHRWQKIRPDAIGSTRDLNRHLGKPGAEKRLQRQRGLTNPKAEFAEATFND